jgi:hypothetical protein
VIGYAFWTTELVPLERGFGGPIPILVGIGDIDAVSCATITMSAAVRTIRSGSRRIARQPIAPPS